MSSIEILTATSGLLAAHVFVETIAQQTLASAPDTFHRRLVAVEELFLSNSVVHPTVNQQDRDEISHTVDRSWPRLRWLDWFFPSLAGLLVSVEGWRSDWVFTLSPDPSFTASAFLIGSMLLISTKTVLATRVSQQHLQRIIRIRSSRSNALANAAVLELKNAEVTQPGYADLYHSSVSIRSLGELHLSFAEAGLSQTGPPLIHGLRSRLQILPRSPLDGLALDDLRTNVTMLRQRIDGLVNPTSLTPHTRSDSVQISLELTPPTRRTIVDKVRSAFGQILFG